MVETAGKTKKNYNKIGTEDDPVIIAQRFLNIFRQLHIFTDERKQAFNQMILEQPAEIRGMFSSLPGGAVLQQYVDELEEKAKRGEVISLSALAAAVKAEDGRTPQRDPDGKKPSIRAQLKANRAQSGKPQQREKEQEAKRSIRQALEME